VPERLTSSYVRQASTSHVSSFNVITVHQSSYRAHELEVSSIDSRSLRWPSLETLHLTINDTHSLSYSHILLTTQHYPTSHSHNLITTCSAIPQAWGYKARADQMLIELIWQALLHRAECAELSRLQSCIKRLEL